MIALATPPLIPDGDEARRWAEQELADPAYRAAEPTPFDRFARDVAEFVSSLFSGDVSPALTPWLALLVIAAIVAVVALAVWVWGRPQRTVRSSASTELFGVDDARPAARLRADAEAAAARGEWDDALVLRFRALARGLVERTVVDLEPGATVHRFARQAARAFAAERDELERAADLFDDVRYLRRPGGEPAYRAVTDLDERLTRAAPTLDALEGMPA